MAALLWAVAGFILVAAEMLVGDFTLIMLGGGAFAAALATLLGAPLWLAAIVFAITSFVLLGLLKPVLRRHLQRQPTIPTNTAALIGGNATAVAGFSDSGGQVRIGGDIWSARPATPGTAFAAGEHLVVRDIDGAVAVVDRG